MDLSQDSILNRPTNLLRGKFSIFTWLSLSTIHDPMQKNGEGMLHKWGGFWPQKQSWDLFLLLCGPHQLYLTLIGWTPWLNNVWRQLWTYDCVNKTFSAKIRSREILLGDWVGFGNFPRPAHLNLIIWIGTERVLGSILGPTFKIVPLNSELLIVSIILFLLRSDQERFWWETE